MTEDRKRTPNKLVTETSPYLLQHAYNPVDWLPFSDAAFEKARTENKPVLISIGYSACHWCHVMERESFEDLGVAELMNARFINIKVDREERSDVDMLYMQAVQLMTGQGGWPLNCFVLPDGRPFYGGTYFNKTQWLNVLQNLSDIYTKDPAKVEDYATELTRGIKQSEIITTSSKNAQVLDRNLLKESVAKWKEKMDSEHGGPNRAPKFPLPNNYQFLLRYSVLEKDRALLDHVELTLQKMAFGGIYDQLRGGFSRYSTDILWKVPHFEKMLYDNAQLVSLYSEAYVHTKNDLYREIAVETLDFVEQEWFTKEGAFYSAYDADSEGEEGKYYVWNEEELKSLLADDYALFADYFGINNTGYWEHGNYILMRSANRANVMLKFDLTEKQLYERIGTCRAILKNKAGSRVKPGLDDKSITSWNAMMSTAFANAYLSFGQEKHKKIAVMSMNFILGTLVSRDGKLFRTYKHGKARIGGFLEDYAFVIEALIRCYMITQDEKYIEKAKEMTEVSLESFSNPDSDLLYYTSHSASVLVARTTETSDNVIPASNSQMALNLFQLGLYFDKPEWGERAEKMMSNFTGDIRNYGAGYSNWACLALNLTYPFKELAVVGNNVNEKLRELYQHGITNAIFAVHAESSDLPLLKDRFVAGKTMFYVCENRSCKLPVTSVDEALQQLA